MAMFLYLGISRFAGSEFIENSRCDLHPQHRPPTQINESLLVLYSKRTLIAMKKLNFSTYSVSEWLRVASEQEISGVGKGSHQNIVRPVGRSCALQLH